MSNLKRIDGNILSPSALNAAVAWAKHAVPILAIWGINHKGQCDCGDRDCSSPGKHPIGIEFPNGMKSATLDTQKLQRVFRKYPGANLAIVPTGSMVVFDIDNQEGQNGFDGLGLPDTAFVETGRGRHYYFRLHSALPDMPKMKGVDVRTAGNGYLVVPPSNHKNGCAYRWGRSGTVESFPTVLRSDRRVRVAFSASTARASVGSRNMTLTSFAGYLRFKGLSAPAIEATLKPLNEHLCDPPLAESELHAIARSVGSYQKGTEDAFADLSGVKVENVEWLAKPYFVQGATTVIDGNPGQGKSTFVTAIVAAVTSPSKKLSFLPDLKHGDVLILSAEDDPARVLKPRLLANGADTNRIRFQKRPFTLDTHGLQLLRAEIERHRPLVVVIDPLIAYMANTDLHKANETMRFMVDLDQIAREFDAAILVVRHLRKSEADDPLYRGLGSIAISARVRSALVLGRHPEDPEIRAVAQSKCSYAKEGPTILFELKSGEGSKHPVVKWLGTDTALSAEELLARPPAQRGRPDNTRESAKQMLIEMLDDGPQSKLAIGNAAEARAISMMTLRRAAEDLRIIKKRNGKRTTWSLPRRFTHPRKVA